ncbi:hypothetical protein KCU95_g2056, partial [Aureobasidium melanogenum]
MVPHDWLAENDDIILIRDCSELSTSPSIVSQAAMKYVNSREELDQPKHALDIPEVTIDPDLDRSKKKGKSKQKTKTQEMEKIPGTTAGQKDYWSTKKILTFSAAEFFKFLFHAVEDGQDITYLEKKYLTGSIKHPERIVFIEKEDYELVKEWSVKYEVPAIVRRVHEIVSAQTRKIIDKKYHERVVEWIFEDVSAIRDDIRDDLKGSEKVERYDKLFEKLSILVLELARCDLALETGNVKSEDVQTGYGEEVD